MALSVLSDLKAKGRRGQRTLVLGVRLKPQRPNRGGAVLPLPRGVARDRRGECDGSRPAVGPGSRVVTIDSAAKDSDNPRRKLSVRTWRVVPLHESGIEQTSLVRGPSGDVDEGACERSVATDSSREEGPFRAGRYFF